MPPNWQRYCSCDAISVMIVVSSCSSATHPLLTALVPIAGPYTAASFHACPKGSSWYCTYTTVAEPLRCPVSSQSYARCWTPLLCSRQRTETEVSKTKILCAYSRSLRAFSIPCVLSEPKYAKVSVCLQQTLYACTFRDVAMGHGSLQVCRHT